ncbi:MATE family efflux transporter [Leptospira andrefontaineae]|uniref:MATE family efflux transporter n=1 Tax=Leptospira andrefontaineae TaxID=2484976 RepID=A0A4R9H1A8_9LEPT|nr:MATE family efflux transporter [Leptospira andrefontaineae]TGK38085.1 MATE family efflux transporter [Leptospira andrefontaineae]
MSLLLEKKFLTLTFFNIIANLTVPLTSFADVAVLGQLESHTYVAGVALANVLFDYLFWGFSFLRMSTTGLTAQAEGNEDNKESFQILLRSLLLGLGIGVLILLTKTYLEEFGFSVLEGEKEVKSAGGEYFKSRIISAPATLCNFVLTGWFLGRSKSATVLVATVIANLVNIGLNIWFILFLDWKAYGAGIATSISQYLMCAFFLVLLFKEKDRFLQIYHKIRIFSLKGYTSLLSLNSDIMIRTLLLITTFSLFRNYSSGLGSETLAANAILHQLILIGAFWIDGAAIAMETVAGNLKGNNNSEGLRKILKMAILSGFGISLFFCLLILLPAGFLFELFSKSKPVVALAKEYGYWIAPVLLFGSFAFIFDGFFLGISEGKILRNSMIVSSIVFFFPIAYWGKIQNNNHILWLSLSFYMLGRAITLGTVAYKKYFVNNQRSFS